MEGNKNGAMYNKYLIMKWNLIAHNIRGLNDPESIRNKMWFINFITPKVDIILLQEHKLRGRSIKNIETRLMPGCASWVLEAASSG